jgi:hypothetical protein
VCFFEGENSNVLHRNGKHYFWTNIPRNSPSSSRGLSYCVGICPPPSVFAYCTLVQLGSCVQLGQLRLFLLLPSLSPLSGLVVNVQLGVSHRLFSTAPQLGTLVQLGLSQVICSVQCTSALVYKTSVQPCNCSKQSVCTIIVNKNTESLFQF